ncbi:MAG: hypothetical protein KAG53_00690 [Endozoicomonadaceae bacterium]|nr:hypothetical protein [Endozoicomonadaceae bacterium]
MKLFTGGMILVQCDNVVIIVVIFSQYRSPAFPVSDEMPFNISLSKRGSHCSTV